MRFAIGDHVQWTSQASGGMRTKRGVVIAIVPKGVFAARILDILQLSTTHNVAHLDGGWSTRAHDSCLIAEDHPAGSQAKPQLYWPRVAYLHKVGTDENAP